jgi:hypothetical protein
MSIALAEALPHITSNLTSMRRVESDARFRTVIAYSIRLVADNCDIASHVVCVEAAMRLGCFATMCLGRSGLPPVDLAPDVAHLMNAGVSFAPQYCETP